jgi:hypothetical protein
VTALATACIPLALLALAALPALAQAPSGPVVPDWVRLARELKRSVVYIAAKGTEGASAGGPRKPSGLERFFGLHRQSAPSQSGDAIAVTTTFYSPIGASIGIGFAIPADLARATLERIAGKPLTGPP